MSIYGIIFTDKTRKEIKFSKLVFLAREEIASLRLQCHCEERSDEAISKPAF